MSWIDSIPLPALHIDADGSVLAANRLAQKLFDRPHADLIGLRLDHPSIAAALRPISTIPLADGSLQLFSDASLVDRLQQQVYHLSRLASAGRLVAVVVHEINNALAGIVGYAQFLLAQPLADGPRRDLQRIHEEALRTARVAQNLLRFSKSGRGERGPVRMDELLQRCADLKRRDFALRSIKLELDLAPELPTIDADEALLSQVFINLLTNAQQGISALKERGHVVLRARTTRRRLVIDVVDDGPGIPEPLRERIFDPFFTSRSDGSGTGLGLTLCREILHDHAGEIRVARQRGTGARMRVSLPVVAHSGAPARPQEPPAPAVQIDGCRIVVVEDEPALREVITRTFSARGGHVITFEHGEDALSFLANEPVDVVVSDIHRPGLDGMQLYEELARTRPALLRRFVFVTGDALREETAAFLRRSRAHVLRKPLELDQLVRAAHSIVQRASAQGELFKSAPASGG